MADFYYIYDPADNLALGQAIQLANTDGGMSYIVPFANKSGVVDPGDPASVGLGVIETAIAAGPLHAGGSHDPISNRLTASQFQGKVSAAQWSAIKAMVKASIDQAPPAGWNETSLEAADSIFSVISADAYSQLHTKVFHKGTWTSADSSGRRGNPFIALGGVITDAVFVDYSGHHVPTPSLIGEIVVDPSGQTNNGTLYDPPPGSLTTAFDEGDPAYGLGIQAPNKDVTLVNFSATSIGFGPSNHLTDSLGLAGASPATGIPLAITAGRVTLAGDLVIDQVVQVFHGTTPRRAPITMAGADSQVTIRDAKVFLGSTRGYQSLINVHDDATLLIDKSTIYGFSSSNSNAPLLPGDGLDWGGFVNTINGSAAISHLLSATDGGSIRLLNSEVLREEIWQPQSVDSTFAANLYNISRPQVFRWNGNDYGVLSDGDLHVGADSRLEIINSRILASIVADGNSTLKLDGSVVAGSPVGETLGSSLPPKPPSLVQLKGATADLQNSLIDSLDALMLGGGSLQLGLDTHILTTNTGSRVSTTSNPDYRRLSSFAGPSTRKTLLGWADRENASTGNKAVFTFQGPTTTRRNPEGITRSLTAQLSEAGAPQQAASGAVTYQLMARFQEAVKGMEETDVRTALGRPALAAGWTVSGPPVSSDGGITWRFRIRSPRSFAAAVPMQLAAGAASSALVDGLATSASNTFRLAPMVSGGGVGVGGGGGHRCRPIKATPGVDVLTGTDHRDLFLFPGLVTGKPRSHSRRDRITNYADGDRIRVGRIEMILAEPSVGHRAILGPAAMAESLKIHDIAKALGAGFGAHHAAVITAEGKAGSFLVVNNGRPALNDNDMLVHFQGFTPTPSHPLLFG